MKYQLFNLAKSAQYICLCRDMRQDYELVAYEALDAPQVLPAGSVEGFLDDDYASIDEHNPPIGYLTTTYRK